MSAEIVPLDTAIRRKEERERAAWNAYLAARARAEETRAIEDGRVAGKAWAEWLSLFTGRAS